MPNRKPVLLFLVTEDWYFCSHRLSLGVAAAARGYDVCVVTRVRDHGSQITQAGLRLLPFGLARGSKNPFRELRALLDLARIYRRVRPTIVHHVGLKPVLYGSLVASISRPRVVVNALAGMGYLFSSTDWLARMLRPFVEASYRLLLNRPRNWVIVQNPDDRDLLRQRQIVSGERTVLIRGSGVDLARYAPSPEPTGVPVVILPARLLRDKGVREFVVAASALKERGVEARFALVGEPDPDNPAAIAEQEIAGWVSAGVVEMWGWRSDMPEVFHQAHIVCLPSYREGLPKVLIEAAACGRPIVTCDVPGCREVVRHGVNGLLVPARDATALADALAQLLRDPARRMAMGLRARQIAVEEFSVETVIERTLLLYADGLALDSSVVDASA